MNNTNNCYAIFGFLSGGIFMYFLNSYKINYLEKKIKELEETNIYLLNNMMILDSTRCNTPICNHDNELN